MGSVDRIGFHEVRKDVDDALVRGMSTGVYAVMRHAAVATAS